MPSKLLDTLSALQTGKVAPLFGNGLARVNEIAQFLNTVEKHDNVILRTHSNVVDDETWTVHNDVYEVDIINTSTGATSAASVAAFGALTVTITAHNLKVGSLIRMDNEIMRVGQILDANTVYIAPFGGQATAGAAGTGAGQAAGIVSGRGACGTTQASHTSVTIYESDDPTEVYNAGHYPIGLVTTLTPAAFQTAFTGTINDHPAPYNPATDYVAIAVDTGAPAGYYGVMVIASQLGKFGWKVSTTSAGSGNVWDASTFNGGRPAEQARIFAGHRVITAEDVTKTQFNVPFDFSFEPGCRVVQVYRPGTGVISTWDGLLTFANPGKQQMSLTSTGTATPTGGTYILTITVKGIQYATSAISYSASASTVATDILAATRADGTALSSDYANATVTGSGGALPGTVETFVFDLFSTLDIQMYVTTNSLTPSGSAYTVAPYPATGQFTGSTETVPNIPTLATFTLGTSHDYAAGDIVSWVFSE
jgi:hypothetical protein